MATANTCLEYSFIYLNASVKLIQSCSVSSLHINEFMTCLKWHKWDWFMTNKKQESQFLVQCLGTRTCLVG